MQHWEYRIENVLFYETNYGTRADRDFGIQELNGLGADGWELVTTETFSGQNRLVQEYYFKRQLD